MRNISDNNPDTVSISITLDVYSHLFQGDYGDHVHSLDDPPHNNAQREGSGSKSATQAQPPDQGESDQIAEAIEFK